MIKKVVLIIATFVFIFIVYRTIISVKAEKSVDFSVGKESTSTIAGADVVAEKTFYAYQALQAKDDYLGTYKNEESTWTNQTDGVVGTTGLLSGEIRKDERTGLWWSASSSSTVITNRLDIEATDGVRITGGDAVAFCDGLNNAVFGGKSDWYLPTQKELMQAYIDGIYSQDPDFGTTNVFWSSTEHSRDPKKAWYVGVGYGFAFSEDKSIAYSARCVRRD